MIEKETLIAMVRGMQAGDSTAAAQMYETFQEDIYYFILKTVNNDRELAEDLTQDTFLAIMEKIHTLDEPVTFVTWSKQIAYHKCTDHFKKRKELLLDENEDGTTAFDLQVEENGEFIPDEALDSKELKQTIMDMVNQLSEEQRSVILLRYFNEISVKEIAQIQQVSEGTVKSRLNYARKAIKQSVENYEKKNGIKLHCFGVVPLLLWLFREYRLQNGLSLTADTASAVYGASQAAATAGAATGTAAAGAASAAAGNTAAAVGVKLAGKALAAKIVAAVTALAVTTGGAVAVATTIAQQEKPESAYVETVPQTHPEDDVSDATVVIDETVPEEETDPTEETVCDHAETEQVYQTEENGRYLGVYHIVCINCGEVIQQVQEEDYNEGSASDEEAIEILNKENGTTGGSTEESEDELIYECVNHSYVVSDTWTDPSTGIVYTFHTCTVCSYTYSSSGTPGQPDYEVGNGAPDGYYAEQNGTTETPEEDTEVTEEETEVTEEYTETTEEYAEETP